MLNLLIATATVVSATITATTVITTEETAIITATANDNDD